MRWRSGRGGCWPLAGLAAGAGGPTRPTGPRSRKWRASREARLKADGGWLTLAGLFWLKEGPNRFGTDPGGDIVLPEGSAPAKAGVFVFEDGQDRAAPR